MASRALCTKRTYIRIVVSHFQCELCHITTARDSDVGDCGDAVVGLSQTTDTLAKSCGMTVMTHPHAWLQDLVRQFRV